MEASVVLPESNDTNARGLSASNYARNKRDLMNLVNQIRSTGAAVEVDLPTIVVAGNQSSGKSSLIEAISGINLPRAAGTCTRVPIEVRLRQEEKQDWNCVVKIRRELKDDGSKHNAANKPEFPFGATIFDPKQVESTIRRAQLAILNPTVPFTDFVNYVLPEQEESHPLGSERQLAFSRNVVVLEISGPNVVDLTLVDLPGIVQYVSKGEDENNVDLVTNLVKSYIQKDCLILLVITMKDDIQNQKAVSLAQEVDPMGRRTIGVLTKADTLQSTREIQPWIKVLGGLSEPLHHGYFVTRQPNVDELAEHISFEQARLKESDFFSNTPQWSSLPLALQRRLGTKNLTASLSDHLMALIREKLPTLIEEINTRYGEISKELIELGGKPSDDSAGQMMNLVSEFTDNIKWNTLGGRPGHEHFLQEVNRRYEQFKLDIRNTAPRFSAKHPSKRKRDDEVEDVEEEEEEEDDASSSDDDCLDDLEDVAEGDLGPAGMSTGVMYLEDISKHIKSSVTRELKGNVPFSAIDQLIHRFLQPWERQTIDLLDKIRPVFEKMLETAVHDTFGQYEQGMLPVTIRGIITETTRTLFTNAHNLLRSIAALDNRPFTQNDHYLSDLQAKILTRYKEQLSPSPPSLPPPPTTNEGRIAMNNALSYLSKAGIQLSEAKLRKALEMVEVNSGNEVARYETELKTMAQVRAYWQVAYKRIIDYVPMIIDAEFIVPASQAIYRAVIQDLAILSDDGQSRCRALLAESPDITRLREDLQLRKERLAQAKEAIRKLGMK